MLDMWLLTTRPWVSRKAMRSLLDIPSSAASWKILTANVYTSFLNLRDATHRFKTPLGPRRSSPLPTRSHDPCRAGALSPPGLRRQRALHPTGARKPQPRPAPALLRPAPHRAVVRLLAPHDSLSPGNPLSSLRLPSHPGLPPPHAPGRRPAPRGAPLLAEPLPCGAFRCPRR